MTLSGIIMTPGSATLGVGATGQLAVTGTYSDGTRAPITTGLTFSSSAPAVAAVSSSGVVTALSVGSSTVTAQAAGLTATATVAVVPAPTLVSIAVVPDSVPLAVGGKAQLTVIGTYSDQSTQDLTVGSTFVSSLPGVATVSAAGLVTAVAVGTSTVTATHTASGRTAAATVSVPTLVSIAVAPPTFSLVIGAKAQLTVIGTYSDSSTANLTAGSTFISTAPGVATVTSAGLVTAVANGSTTIVATHTASGKIATATATVAPALTSIALTPNPVNLTVGERKEMIVTGTYSDSTTKVLTSGWTLSAAGVAPPNAVTVSGIVVTGAALGTATLVATETASGLVSPPVPVTVTAQPITVVSIALTPSPVNLVVTQTQGMTVTGTMSSGSPQDLTTGSTLALTNVSPAGAVTVSGAVVTAVAPGTATLTATHTLSGKVSPPVTVTVSPRTLVSIALTPSPVNLVVTQTQGMTVTGTYDFGPTATLTADSTLALTNVTPAGAVTVSGAVVTGVAAGTATLTATHTASGKVSPPVDVTVTGAVPVIAYFRATPPSINSGQSATLEWSVNGALSLEIDQGVGIVTGTASKSVTPLITTTYTLTATNLSGPSSAMATVTVATVSPTSGAVFVNGAYSPDVTFVAYGGSTNDVTIDATEQRNGFSTLKVVVPAANYTGGTFVAAAPRDLTGFNTLTYWAKASTANTVNNTGIGNDPNSTNTPFRADSNVVPLTATWTKYYVPIPNPAKITSNPFLFDFAEGPKSYTIWFSDIQYEFLVTGVDPPNAATIGWPAVNVPVNGTFQINPANTVVTFTNPPNINQNGPDNRLTDVGFGYFDLLAGNTAFATVSASGLVTGVAQGSTDISAKLGTLNVPGVAPVTVTGTSLPVPQTAAPTPPVRAASDVVSLYTSSGIYNSSNIAVATWATGWGVPNTVTDFPIGAVTVKKYAGVSYVGVDYASTDATTFTHFHVDIWTPDASKFGVKLVNGAGSPPTSEKIVGFNATTTPAISTGGWISLDIPLTSFTGMSFDRLNQLLWLDNGDVPPGGVESGTFYIDNVYFWK